MAWEKWIMITWVAMLWLSPNLVGANPSSTVDIGALTMTVQHQIEKFGETSPQTLSAMLNIAIAYDAQGDYKGAVPWAEKTVKISGELYGAKSQNTAVCIGLLAGEYRKQGRYSEALPFAEKILEIHREIHGEQHLDTLTSLVMLAQDYRAVGRYSEVISVSQRTLEIGGELLGANHKLTLIIQRGLAGDYRRLGRYAEAMALDEKILIASIETLGERHQDTIVSYSNLATDYRRIGRFTDALAVDEKALKLAKEVLGNTHLETLNLMSNLATDYRKLERYNDALALDKKVLAEKIVILGEANASTLVSMNNLASDYFAIDKYSEAAELHKKALTLSNKVLGEKHPDTLATQNNLALDYNRLGRYSEALKLEETLLKSKSEVLGGGHPDTLSSINNLASNYYTQGRFDESAVLLQQLINGIEELRGQSDLSTENRQSLFAQWIPAYKNLAVLQAERNQADNAFYLSELTKARTLLELTANNFADNSGILTEEEAQQLADYHRQVNQLNDRIVNSIDNADERIRIEGVKRDVLTRLNEYRGELQNKYPKYQQLSEVQIANAQTAQHSLPEKAVFISYIETNDNKVVAFVIDNSGGLKAIPLGLVSGLDDMVEVYRELLSYRDMNHMHSSKRYLWKLPEGYTVTGSMLKPAEKAIIVRENTELFATIAEIGKELSSHLLLPIASELKGKEQLIISPDGALALIPFETLILEEKALISSYDISYVQSLSMLTMLKQRAEVQSKATNRKGLLAIGDAYYQLGKNNLPNGSMIRTRSGGFQDLPLSEPELNALAGLFGEQGDIYKKDEATEAQLKELNQSKALEKYKYIVFSAHGYFDDKEPAFNSIVLGLKNPVAGTDGYVTVAQWPAFELNSELVYMSACETGRGKFVPGEGVLGLTYALYVAGNRNSIATLWKILDDESSVEFTRSFFAKLLAGEGQVKALSATKREFLNSKYAKPIYWAPFVLYGI